MLFDVIVLAAGSGTRMRSNLPKMLHRVAGRSMVGWSVDLAQQLGAREVVVVTGHGADAVEAELANTGVRFARQAEQRGTADAFLCGARELSGDAPVLVLYGDTPLLSTASLRALMDTYVAQGGGLALLTGELPDATGYGRIVREHGVVVGIVEEKAATDEQKKIREFNSGVYAMDPRARELAETITDDNPAGEFYLTDILGHYRAAGLPVGAVGVREASEVTGANTRLQLAEAEAVMQRRLRERWMLDGVTMHLPETVYLEVGVRLARDVTLESGVVLRGDTVVEEGCTVGAHSVLENTRLEAGARVLPHSVLQGARVGEGSSVGPFARLRPGAVLEAEVHVGNFVEIKNTRMARGAKAGHLAYLGDAEVGEESNIGAGTITANYDGLNKHRTVIGSGVFVGSNSTLVAPRTLGDAAFVAAGSTVTEDVPEGALAVARGRQRTLEGWSRRFWDQAGLKHPWLRRWLGHKP